MRKKTKTPVTRKDTSQKARKKAAIKRAKPKQGIHLNLPYDSQGEYYFLKWAEELLKSGHIISIKRADSYILTDGCINNYTQKLKRGTSSKTVSQVLLRPSLYTPEFEIEWGANYGDFVWIFGENCKYEKPLIGHKVDNKVITIIECKPDFDRSNMTRLFVNNQKFMWAKYNLFVNLVKPTDFFTCTFCPESFKTTQAGKKRFLKFTPRTLDEYLIRN